MVEATGVGGNPMPAPRQAAQQAGSRRQIWAPSPVPRLIRAGPGVVTRGRLQSPLQIGTPLGRFHLWGCGQRKSVDHNPTGAAAKSQSDYLSHRCAASTAIPNAVVVRGYHSGPATPFLRDTPQSLPQMSSLGPSVLGSPAPLCFRSRAARRL